MQQQLQYKSQLTQSNKSMQQNNVQMGIKKSKQILHIDIDDSVSKVLPSYQQFRKGHKQSTISIKKQIKTACQPSAGRSSLFTKNEKIQKIKNKNTTNRQQIKDVDKASKKARQEQNNSIFSQLQTQKEQQVEVALEERLIIKICDGLYMGGEGSIWDIDTLAANYITHLIRTQQAQQNERQGQQSATKRQERYVPEIISHLHIVQGYEYGPSADISHSGSDRSSQTLQTFNKVAQFIQHAHEQGQSCLIISSSKARGSCSTFRNIYQCVYRPSVIACGYLMYRYSWALLKSLQFVTSRLTAGQKTSEVLKQANYQLNSLNRISSIHSLSHRSGQQNHKPNTHGQNSDSSSNRVHSPHHHLHSTNLTSIQSQLLAHMVPQLPHNEQQAIDLSHIPLYSLNLLESQLVNTDKRVLSYGWSKPKQQDGDIQGNKLFEQSILLTNTYMNSNIGMQTSVSYHALLNSNIHKINHSISKSKLNKSANITTRGSFKIIKHTKDQSNLHLNDDDQQNPKNGTHRVKYRHSVDTNNHNALMQDQYTKDRAVLQSILKYDRLTQPILPEEEHKKIDKKSRGRHSLSAGYINMIPNHNPTIKIVSRKHSNAKQDKQSSIHKENNMDVRKTEKTDRLNRVEREEAESEREERRESKRGRKTIHLYSQEGKDKANKKGKRVSWCNELVRQEKQQQCLEERLSNEHINQYRLNLLAKFNIRSNSGDKPNLPQKQKKSQMGNRQPNSMITPAVRNKIVVNVIDIINGRNGQTDRNAERHIEKHRTLINKKSSINQSKAKLPTIHDLLNNSASLNQSIATQSNKESNNQTLLNRCKTMISIGNDRQQLQEYVDSDMAIVLSQGNEQQQTKQFKQNKNNHQNADKKVSQNHTQTILEEELELDDMELRTQPFEHQKQNINKENNGFSKNNSASLNTSLKNSLLLMSKSEQLHSSLAFSQSSSLSSLALLESKSKNFQDTINKSKSNKHSAFTHQEQYQNKRNIKK